MRTDTSPAVEVAIVHDGTDRGIGEAEQYAQLLGLSPVMLTLLQEALGACAERFDAPDDAPDGYHYQALIEQPDLARLTLEHAWDEPVRVRPEAWTLPAGAFGEGAGTS